MRANLRFRIFWLAVAIVLAGCTGREPAVVNTPRVRYQPADVVPTQVIAPTPVFGRTAQNEPPGRAVIDDPGLAAVDVAPDPAQRNYVSDPGFPPGTYAYNGYYYYGGYRYPQDAFVSGYVQNNLNQRRFVNVGENRVQVDQIAKQEREVTAANNRAAVQSAAAAARSVGQTPVRQQQSAPAATLKRHEITATVNQENQPPAQQSENRTPAEARHVNGEAGESRGPAEREPHESVEHGEKTAGREKGTAKSAGGEARHEK
ncbi:MAG TPA: hypothetical protein VG326_03740 [Tepidisphaeraceae bacterium]|nr:hypothetical protein [Tepidisphaeraceae bacterium]